MQRQLAAAPAPAGGERAPLTKEEFYRRYHAGEFGNRPRTWDSLGALLVSDFDGRVTVRSRRPGGPCRYGVPVSALRDGLSLTDTADATFNESMPDHLLTLQGNVWLGYDGVQLEYSTEPNVGHRQATSEPLVRRAARLEALALLRKHLWPSDLEELDELLQRFPEAVVEFSAYRTSVGVLPRRNAVIWEVRNY